MRMIRIYSPADRGPGDGVVPLRDRRRLGSRAAAAARVVWAMLCPVLAAAGGGAGRAATAEPALAPEPAVATTGATLASTDLAAADAAAPEGALSTVIVEATVLSG